MMAQLLNMELFYMLLGSRPQGLGLGCARASECVVEVYGLPAPIFAV